RPFSTSKKGARGAYLSVTTQARFFADARPDSTRCPGVWRGCGVGDAQADAETEAQAPPPGGNVVWEVQRRLLRNVHDPLDADGDKTDRDDQALVSARYLQHQRQRARQRHQLR